MFPVPSEPREQRPLPAHRPFSKHRGGDAAGVGSSMIMATRCGRGQQLAAKMQGVARWRGPSPAGSQPPVQAVFEGPREMGCLERQLTVRPDLQAAATFSPSEDNARADRPLRLLAPPLSRVLCSSRPLNAMACAASKPATVNSTPHCPFRGIPSGGSPSRRASTASRDYREGI